MPFDPLGSPELTAFAASVDIPGALRGRGYMEFNEKEMKGQFDLANDLLAQGGYGRIQSIWPGPPASDNSVQTAQPEVADPDGSNGVQIFNTLAGMFNELGT